MSNPILDSKVPLFKDSCNHDPAMFVGVASHHNKQVDIYLFQQDDSWSICLRFGNAPEDYDSGILTHRSEQILSACLEFMLLKTDYA